MLEINHISFRRNKGLGRHQRGGAAVEFALLAVIFFTFVFGVLEIARAIYMFNILQEVTRRAGTLAANSNFDEDTLDTIRSQALFSDRNGNLLFGAPITPDHLKIDYFSVSRDGATGAVTPQPISSMPTSPAQNYANCVSSPYDSGCIRLVRVRVCQPDDGGDCTPVPYQMQFPLIDLSGLILPRSETIVPANTLGYRFSPVTGP
jgi:Flp pilus assembly protein TadG